MLSIPIIARVIGQDTIASIVDRDIYLVVNKSMSIRAVAIIPIL